MKFIVISKELYQIIDIFSEEDILKQCANDQRMYDDVVRAIKARPERADGKTLWFIVEDEEVGTFAAKIKKYGLERPIKKRTQQPIAKDLPFERWKEIDGFPNYRVSNYGRIKSIKTKKLLKGQQNYNCLAVALVNRDEDRRKMFNVGNLVLMAFKPVNRDMNKLHIRHLDNDVYNNRLENLEWII